MNKKAAKKVFLDPMTVYKGTLKLAEKLVTKLAAPSTKWGYCIIGVSRGGINLALTLQGELSRLWKSPCGLAIYIPSINQYDKNHKKTKVADRTWRLEGIQVTPAYHTRHIIVDDILDSGDTYKELQRRANLYYPNLTHFAFLYSKQGNPAPEDITVGYKAGKDHWLVFPHERDENHTDSELCKLLV